MVAQTAEVQNELEAMHGTLTDESEELQKGTGLNFRRYKRGMKLGVIVATETIRNKTEQRRGRIGRVWKVTGDRNGNGVIGVRAKWIHAQADITHTGCV